MNGIHDLGGMHGLGPVTFEANEPLFHEEWEGHLLAAYVVLIRSGAYNVHEFRHSVERIPPLEYLGSPYYLRWLDACERLLIEKGLITKEELASGPLPKEGSASGPRSSRRPLAPPPQPPRFKAGDRLRVKTLNPKTHTRLPRYVHGRLGTVVACMGDFEFADSLAQEKYDTTQYVYRVRFEGSELWGPDADPKHAVYLDLYESYFEVA